MISEGASFEDGSSCKCGSAGLQAACVRILYLSSALSCFTCLETMNVSVSLCSPAGTCSQSWHASRTAAIICITTGNWNCELRFFPSPVRGEGAVRKGRTCILCVCERPINLWNHREILNFLLFYYIYMETLSTFGKYKACFVLDPWLSLASLRP